MHTASCSYFTLCGHDPDTKYVNILVGTLVYAVTKAAVSVSANYSHKILH